MLSLPPPLKAGDTVALVAPCSAQESQHHDLVQEAIQWLEAQSLKVKVQHDIDAQHFYLAGTDTHRAAQFQKLYTDPKVRALFITRGGYGASRLWEHLDDKLIAKHQKRVVGFSDATSLLLYLQKVCQMVVFHGPCLATPQFLKEEQHSLNQSSLYTQCFDTKPSQKHTLQSLNDLKPLECTGLLTGGCLSLVVGTLGTPYEIETDGKILFLEEVNEAPFRVDRMLTHLKNAGKLEGLKGIVFSEMTGCEGEGGLLWQVLQDFFKDTNYPILYGLPSGHGSMNHTLPLGNLCSIQGSELIIS